jgi:hypothetical protein
MEILLISGLMYEINRRRSFDKLRIVSREGQAERKKRVIASNLKQRGTLTSKGSLKHVGKFRRKKDEKDSCMHSRRRWVWRMWGH